MRIFIYLYIIFRYLIVIVKYLIIFNIASD